jgi:hypothetical protein
MTLAIMSNGDIRTAITEIGASGRGLQDKIHTVAVSCLAHIAKHGDTTLGASLLAALPSGQRVKTLALWFKTFSNGKAQYSADKAGVWTCKLDKDRTEADFDLVAADATQFGDLVPEKDPSPLTMAKFLAMVEKVANDDTTLKSGARKVPAEVAAVAAGMIASVRAAA